MTEYVSPSTRRVVTHLAIAGNNLSITGSEERMKTHLTGMAQFKRTAFSGTLYKPPYRLDADIKWEH